MRKYLYLGIALLFALGSAVYWFWGRPQGSGVTFRTEPVTRGELLATVGGTGTLLVVVLALVIIGYIPHSFSPSWCILNQG